MSNDPSKQEQKPFTPPVSSFTGPIAELVGQQLLSPPSRPGLLASLDHYEILRILGGGGMGMVLLARDSNTGQEVAIKLVKPDLVSNQQVVHRFVKEAGHMQRLRHEHVVPVLEVSSRPQGPYFVMPYFEGRSLSQRIRSGRSLESEAVLDIALQIADGLRFAHQHGIIHRDLKPANILLAADGKACLADFGLARTMFNDTIVDVENQQCEGTAPYMSPAVAAGNAEDTRCDIYAFGALLYEMLTGDLPYKGSSTKEIQKQILAGSPTPITTLNPKADRGLVVVAEGAMARELRDRYADMTDVLSDLQRIKEGKPPLGPHGLGRRVHNKLLRARQSPVILWSAVSVAIVAVLSGIFLLTALFKASATANKPVVRLDPDLIVAVTSLHPASGIVSVRATAPRAILKPFDWRWGDGTSGSGLSPQSHTYVNTATNYTIRITAFYSDGTTGAAETVVGFTH